MKGNSMKKERKKRPSPATLEDLLSHPTATVPDVGRVVFNLSRNGSYAAAKSGGIPTIEVGGQYFVPTAVLRKQLGLEAA
jgi:hypothetical protein